MKIDRIYADIKNQMSKFMANQGILLDLRRKITKISDVKLRDILTQRLNVLYERQKQIETEVIDWIKKVADFKYQLEQKTKNDAGVYDLISNIMEYTGEGLNYLNKGIKLSAEMLKQNKEVETLKKSVEAERIITTDDNLSKLMIAGYGILGLLLFTILAKRKK